MRKPLNIIFAAELALFFLIIGGVLPRQTALYVAVVLAIYVAVASLENGVVLFTISIPIFLALPLTASYDNLNTWRILSAIIFIKWLFKKETILFLLDKLKTTTGTPLRFVRDNKVFILSVVLFVLAVLSLFAAGDKTAGIKRIIYFINLSLIGIVAFDLIKKNQNFGERLIKNITIPVIIVALAGYFQVISTYFVDIYQFMHIWGEGIQCRQFGTEWCYIAVHLGNTWLAYYGSQLSLRVFSLFPDSHSFPVFLLLGLPAVFALGLRKIFADKEIITFRQMIKTRGNLFIVWVPIIFLIAILSGTRGIWAGGIGIIFSTLLILIFMRRRKAPTTKRNILKYLFSYIILFFLLFSIAYPIFASPQFLVSKGNSLLLKERFKSIIDFGETSNSQRIQIWKKTLVSIEHHPLLGVGIGNFPVILSENIELSRAGSSAHNIYLHIAAEMGIVALIIVLYMLWLIFRKIYENFIHQENTIFRIYFGSMLIYFVWVLMYLMTDVVIFDERAFLIFAITLGLILGIKKTLNQGREA